MANGFGGFLSKLGDALVNAQTEGRFFQQQEEQKRQDQIAGLKGMQSLAQQQQMSQDQLLNRNIQGILSNPNLTPQQKSAELMKLPSKTAFDFAEQLTPEQDLDDRFVSLASQQYQAEGFSPEEAQIKAIEDYRASGRASTTVNVGGEKQLSPAAEVYLKEEAKNFSTYKKGLGDAADKSFQTLLNVDSFKDSLEIFQTGGVAPEFRGEFANVIGFLTGNQDIQDYATAKQTIEKIANDLTLGKSSQLVGQISEKEIDFLKASVAGLGSTPEANLIFLDALKTIAERRIAKQRELQDYELSERFDINDEKAFSKARKFLDDSDDAFFEQARKDLGQRRKQLLGIEEPAPQGGQTPIPETNVSNEDLLKQLGI